MNVLDGDFFDPMYSAFLRGELDDNFDEGWNAAPLGIPDLAA